MHKLEELGFKLISTDGYHTWIKQSQYDESWKGKPTKTGNWLQASFYPFEMHVHLKAFPSNEDGSINYDFEGKMYWAPTWYEIEAIKEYFDFLRKK